MLNVARGLAVWLFYLGAQLLLLVAAYPAQAVLGAVTLLLLLTKGLGTAVLFLLVVGGGALLLGRVVPGPLRLIARALRAWARMVLGLRSLRGPNFTPGQGPRRRGYAGTLNRSTTSSFTEGGGSHAA